MIISIRAYYELTLIELELECPHVTQDVQILAEREMNESMMNGRKKRVVSSKAYNHTNKT